MFQVKLYILMKHIHYENTYVGKNHRKDVITALLLAVSSL